MFDNFIGGRWIAPEKKRYLIVARYNSSTRACRIPRSTAEDVEHALDAAHRAHSAWLRLRPTLRAVGLARIGDKLRDSGPSVVDRRDGGVCLPSNYPTEAAVAALTVLATLTLPLQGLVAGCEDGYVDCNSRTCDSAVVKLALAADMEVEYACRRVIPLVLRGHVVVAVLIYQNVRFLPERLLTLMGLMAECLPPGVLNLVSGVGMEAGIPLVASPRGRFPEMVSAQPYPTVAPSHRESVGPAGA